MNQKLRRIAAAALASGLILSASPLAAEPATSGLANANGLQMYYEVYGSGNPVVVLHGAYMSTGQIQPLIDALAKTRQVIAVDLQGHGRTADIDRPISYEAMADDVAALMDAIDVPKADIFGYSMGGGVAYQIAMRHPDHVDRLAAASASFRTDGMYPELVKMIGKMTPDSMAGTPWEAAYIKIAPNPDNFPRLVEKLITLDSQPQAWPEKDMAGIAAPTLVISGDADVIRPEHSVEIFRLRGGGPAADFMSPTVTELAIIPGATHLGVIERTDLLVPMITAFFDKVIVAPTP